MALTIVGIIGLSASVIVLVLVTTLLLHRYTNIRKTSILSLLVTWIGWLFSFAVVLLVPLDISVANYQKCLASPDVDKSNCDVPWINIDEQVLEAIWRTIYWTTYVLCWAVYPILQSYVVAGDFTFMEKLRSAIKENLLFYLAGTIVLAILLIIIAVTKGIHGFNELKAVAIAAANAWGLLLLMLLLGYGLVELPKKMFNRGHKAKTLKFYQYQLAFQREKYDEAKIELDKAMKLVKKYSEKTSATDPLRPFVDIIIEKCPLQYKDIVHGDGEAELKYAKLVSLHKRLMWAVYDLTRTKCLYDTLLTKSFTLEDIVNSKQNPEKRIRWSFREKSWLSLPGRLEWTYKLYIEGNLLRIFALFCGLVSLAVIWSEVFFSIANELSVFYLLLNKVPVVAKLPYLAEYAFVFFPVLYISQCAYWSLFKLRLFNFYQLLPHHLSDANSIMFSASYLCRLAPPLAYNFLLMIQIDNSAFHKVMGDMTPVAFLGTQYNAYFPIVLVVLCVITFFNLYTKFVTKCCIKRFHKFVFDESVSEQQIERGKEILAHERRKREQGITDDDSLPTASPSKLASVRDSFGLKKSTSFDRGASGRKEVVKSSPTPSRIGRNNSESNLESLNSKEKLSFPNFRKIFSKNSSEDTQDLLEKGSRKSETKKSRW